MRFNNQLIIYAHNEKVEYALTKNVVRIYQHIHKEYEKNTIKDVHYLVCIASCDENSFHIITRSWEDGKALKGLLKKSCSNIQGGQDGIGTKEEATQILCNKIRNKKKNVKYQLASLYWEDAASCFKETGRSWDAAIFWLDLESGKLSVHLNKYQSTFGPTSECTLPLTPSEFNVVANKYNMSYELCFMESCEDWKNLVIKIKGGV